MSRLLRLYPKAWRSRYGAELASILDAQPPGLMDRLDLVRGAFDAHLHPELVARDGAPRDVRDPASGSVLGGLLIGLGSALWLAGAFTLAIQPPVFGGRNADPFAITVILAGLCYAAGIARLVWSGGIPGRIGSGVIAAFALMILPMVWPFTLLGYWGLLVSLVVTALNRAVAGRWPAWLAAILVGAAALGFGINVDTGSVWLSMLMPIAMATLAVLSVFGRLPTGSERNLETARAGS